MEKNNTETVKKPLIKDVLQIYLQHWGQQTDLRDLDKKSTLRRSKIPFGKNQLNLVLAGLEISASTSAIPFILLKKSLGGISEEDKAAVFNIENKLHGPCDNGACFFGKTWNLSGWENNDDHPLDSYACDLCVESFQYLQEKGYALPYKNWSVEELVGFGIYKIVD